ncbi:cytochrome c oxidase assembly protein [Neorhizobium sp. SOG26]|uniref:SURF1 family protein n=1 Tax=Neorhizobium sp. SOG26 TaxID=2060726 RepID=UPI000E591BB0|nr:SURF1 family protein [Neorhizobium sp. SOG26]AXV14621.1 cytochrome c oxidase assembly protein [Neorhizobium sp. SOG26]
MATTPQHEETSTGRPRRTLRTVATVVGILVTLAVLLSLGTWQVERLHWKEALLADIAERRAADPVPLAEVETIERDGGDIEYRRVSVTGTFDHGKERHFFATFQGQTGFYVYTPMTLADGRVLFVNRGFVPYEMKDRSTREAGEVSGVQTVTGFARTRLDEKPSAIVPDNDLGKNIFYWKDLSAMVSTTGLEASQVLPFFVDVDASVENAGGWPRGGVTQFDLPNSHLQYAVTWYGLAAALVAVVIGMWFRGRRSQG